MLPDGGCNVRGGHTAPPQVLLLPFPAVHPGLLHNQKFCRTGTLERLAQVTMLLLTTNDRLSMQETFCKL